jgi:hypothetical protein
MDTQRDDPSANPGQREAHRALCQEIHDAWRSAQDDALAAYRDWSTAGREAEPDAYAAYVAAVDREQAAAEHLMGLRQAAADPVTLGVAA